MPTLLQVPDGRVLPTLEADGSRRWLHPRLSVGRTWKARRAVAYLLIAVFTGLPFMEVGGKPAVLLDVSAREFTLLGYTFLPRDTFLLALLMLAWILSIFLTTAVLGRAWCGWVCPQTVYTEFAFRPIERLFMGRRGVGGKPRKGLSPLRYVGMYAAYLVVSLYLAHTFLSYFVGVEALRQWVVQSPLEHPWPFFVVAMVTGAMMFDFSYFREQTCLIACPYGRFQSVLLDRNSLVVKYDAARGEPRRQKGNREAAGGCIDCRMCVETCPTGIDIRDGVQFECINCAQCIDACDGVMGRLELGPGLIGYRSQAMAEGARRRVVRPRVAVYTAAMTVALSALIALVVTKSPMDVLVLRNGGLPFVMTPAGEVEDTLRLQITNRSNVTEQYRVSVEGDGVRAAGHEDRVSVPAGEVVTQPLHLLAGADSFGPAGKKQVTVTVSTRDGKTTLARTVQMFGPAVSPGSAQADAK